MATETGPAADVCWEDAQKWRRSLRKKLDLLEKHEGKGTEDSALEAVEEVMKSYRLACVLTVFADFEFANREKVQKHLWDAHARINTEYRKTLGALNPKIHGDHTIVLHRKVERLYAKFLKTSSLFYKGFIQRLTARFRILELERIAAYIGPVTASLDEVARDDDPALGPLVLQYCHALVLHMGDLARYRRAADRKKHGADAPLSWYRLAHLIMPWSGLGHHQMAVVYIVEKDQDLRIVYHLYHALAVREPHPNAAQNLELEFKKLLPGGSSRGSHASHDPQMTLAAWFVRLHAIYYHGESVAQQAELEREVLHRTQILCITKESHEVLLHIVLANMAAYWVARQRAEKKWSEAISNSCQFLLGFNVRMILAISNALGAEIRATLKAGSSPDGEKQRERYLAAMGTAVPLLRIYMIWLCMHRVDIVQFAPHLAPYASEMHKSLAETISTIIEVFRESAFAVGTCEYMLAEDQETFEFKPLTGSDAANPVCRAMHYTPAGTMKPQPGDSNCPDRREGHVETLCRINDIIKCGYFLATDPRYPLEVVKTSSGSLETLIHVDVDEVTAVATSASYSSPVAEPVAPSKLVISKSDPSAGSTAANGTPSRSTAPLRHDGPSAQLSIQANALAEDDFEVDGETFNRVNQFLTPPEVHSPQPQSPRVDESSYGMHTVTANEIFAAVNPNPAVTTPTSASKKAFPGLPWELIYTPTPYYQPSPNPSLNSVSGQAAAAASYEAGRFDNGGGSRPTTAGSPYPRNARPSGAAAQSSSFGFSDLDLVAGNEGLASRYHNLVSDGEEASGHAHLGAANQASVWPKDSPRLPAAAGQNSTKFMAFAPPPKLIAPVRQPSVPPTGPFFQFSNFSLTSSLPQVGGSPWGPPAARGGHAFDGWAQSSQNQPALATHQHSTGVEAPVSFLSGNSTRANRGFGQVASKNGPSHSRQSSGARP